MTGRLSVLLKNPTQDGVLCLFMGGFDSEQTLSPTFSSLLPHSVIYYLTVLCLFVSVMASSGWLGQDIYSEEEEGSHSSDEEDNSSSSSKEHLSEADRQVIICL